MVSFIMLSVAVLFLGFTSCLATSPGLFYGTGKYCFGPNGFGFNNAQSSDPCKIGPSYWCRPNVDNIKKCNLEWVKNISTCSYSSGICSTVPDLKTFCKNVSNALTYGGGLANVPPGQVGLFILAAFWAPTSCPSNGTGGGFCSELTKKGTIGGRTMQAHGLWPDFGSIYDAPGVPTYPDPVTLAGAYQGWSQYCSPNLQIPDSFDNSKCHVNGGLCPESNVTRQFAYDACLVKYNVSGCVVEEEVFTALSYKIRNYGAAYINRDFALHEFTKHGSCIGGYLTANKTAYFDVTLARMASVRSRSAAIKFVHANRGKNVSATTLISLQQKMSISRCTSDCKLNEFWFCYGIDADGNPTRNPINCGPGNLASESCKKCTGGVIIPDYEKGPNKVI